MRGSDREGFALLTDDRRRRQRRPPRRRTRLRSLLSRDQDAPREFPLGHTVRQPPKNVIHGDPHSANAGFPVPLISFDHDARVRVNRRHGINSLSRMFLIRAYADRYNGFVVKRTKRAAVKRNGHVAKEQSKVSELGRELDKLRARYIAGGGKLLSRRELEREVAERRGSR